MHLLLKCLEIAGVTGALCGCAYYLLALWGARTFRRESQALHPPFAPPVSILKPLRGTDPDIYEAFRSHCLQDYPTYEIIFGVSERDDAAVPLVERLQKEFPRHSIRLVVCEEVLGANRKISNLMQR